MTSSSGAGRVAVVVLFVAVASLGSFGAGAGANDVWEPPPVEEGIELFGCESHYVTLPIAPGVAAQALPDGFRARMFPVGGTLAAAFAVFVQSCEAELPDGSRHADYREAWHLIPVVPPAGWERTSFEVFATGYMTNVPEAAVLFEAWNLAPDADGTIVYAQEEGVQAPGGSAAGAAGPGFSLESVVTGLGQTTTAAFPFLMRTYTADPDGVVRRGMDILIGEGLRSTGHGVVTIGHGGPLGLPYHGEGFSIVYAWADGVRTQTMVPVSFV